MSEPTLGEIYWDAYAAHDVAYVAEVKFADLNGNVRDAIEAGARAVYAHAINRFEQIADEASKDNGPEPAARYALVEQMGFRSTTATVRETTFLGAPMLEVTDLKTGSVHLVSPQSIYEITWLTPDQAHARAKPWTAVALPAAPVRDPWLEAGEDPDLDDEDREQYKRELAEEGNRVGHVHDDPDDDRDHHGDEGDE